MAMAATEIMSGEVLTVLADARSVTECVSDCAFVCDTEKAQLSQPLFRSAWFST